MLVLLGACGPGSNDEVEDFVLENGGDPKRIVLYEGRRQVDYTLDCEDPGCNLSLEARAWLQDGTEAEADLAGLNLVLLRFSAAEVSKDWLIRRTTNVPDPDAFLTAPRLPPGPARLRLMKSDATQLGVEIRAWWGPAEGETPPEIEWSDEGIEQ
jgi:hypothetical protein